MGNKNYTKYSKNNEIKGTVVTPEVTPEGTVVTPEVTPEGTVTKGIITGCMKLYVRSEPTTESEPVTILDENSEVIVTLEESTDDFYKVTLPSGIDGYCMKKYMKISK